VFDSVTPVILTYNEASNIGRTMGKLHWAKDIVVVDSLSSDDTLSIIAGFPVARLFQRKFESHFSQWNFAVKETGITTEWVLALDADYILTDEFIDELKSLDLDSDTMGFRANFIYCVYGHRLRGSVYPPVTVLFRRAQAVYRQDGHTQRVVLDGNIRTLNSSILHDDRKSLSQWLSSQDRYMKLEINQLIQADWKQIGWADRLRKLRVVFPFIMFFYCLFVKGAVFDGSAGLYYSFQRMLAETLLSLRLIQHDFNGIIE
jgi:glycosyltransferase involved in cell wall biosynthesis